MATIPEAQYTMQATADHRFSNSVNRFTRLITGGRDIMLPYDVTGSVFDITVQVDNSRNRDPHAYDTDRDFVISDDDLAVATTDYGRGDISLEELNRITELHDAPGYHFDSTTSDGFNVNVAISGTDPYWSLDYDQDYRISAAEYDIIKANYDLGSVNKLELLKANQFFINGGYHTDAASPYKDDDDFVAGPKGGDPPTYIFDQNGNWRIDFVDLIDAIQCRNLSLISPTVLLRVIQFYNMGGYHDTTAVTEDGYAPGPVPATNLYVGPGFIVRNDMLIHAKSRVKIDLSDTDNYIGDDSSKWGLTRIGSADGSGASDRMYMVLAKYVYGRTSPSPQISYVIANNRAAYLNNRNDYMYLGSFEVDLLGGEFNYMGVIKIYDHDKDETNSDARIERPLYCPIISCADGGVLDEFGNVGPGEPISN